MVNNSANTESNKEPKLTRRDLFKRVTRVAQLALIRLTADQVAPLAKSFSRENPISKEKISPQEHIVILDMFAFKDREGELQELGRELTVEERKLEFYPPEEIKSKQDEINYYSELFNKATAIFMEHIKGHGKLMYDTYITVLKKLKGDTPKSKTPKTINISPSLRPAFRINKNTDTGEIKYTLQEQEIPSKLLNDVKGKIVSFSFQLGEVIGVLKPPEKISKEKYRLITAPELFADMFQKDSELEDDLVFQKIRNFVNKKFGDQTFYSSKDVRIGTQSLEFTYKSDKFALNKEVNELYKELKMQSSDIQDEILSQIEGVCLNVKVRTDFSYLYNPLELGDIEKFKNGTYYASDQYSYEIVGAYSLKNPSRIKALDKIFAFARSLGKNNNILIIPTGNSGDVILPEDKKKIPSNTIIVGSCADKGVPRYGTGGADVYVQMNSSSEATVSFSTLLSYYCSENDVLPSSLNRTKVLKLIDELSVEVNGNKVILIDNLNDIKIKVRGLKL